MDGWVCEGQDRWMTGARIDCSPLMNSLMDGWCNKWKDGWMEE